MTSALERSLIWISMVLSSLMLLVLLWVIAGYVRLPSPVGGVDDWAILLLPLVPPLITAAVSVMAMRTTLRSWIGRAFVMSCLGASTIYLLIPTAHLALQYEIVAADGTAYWAVLAMPAFMIWLPAAVVGLLTGITLRVISARRARG